MMRSFTVVALLTVLAGATSAARAAEGDPPCLADTERFCANVPGTGAFIEGCLRNYWDDLSPECRKNLGSVTDDAVKLGDACESDLDRWCGDAKPGGGERAACLVKNRDRLSSRCRDALDAASAKSRSEDAIVEPAPVPATPCRCGRTRIRPSFDLHRRIAPIRSATPVNVLTRRRPADCFYSCFPADIPSQSTPVTPPTPGASHQRGGPLPSRRAAPR